MYLLILQKRCTAGTTASPSSHLDHFRIHSQLSQNKQAARTLHLHKHLHTYKMVNKLNTTRTGASSINDTNDQVSERMFVTGMSSIYPTYHHPFRRRDWDTESNMSLASEDVDQTPPAPRSSPEGPPPYSPSDVPPYSLPPPAYGSPSRTSISSSASDTSVSERRISFGRDSSASTWGSVSSTDDSSDPVGVAPPIPAMLRARANLSDVSSETSSALESQIRRFGLYRGPTRPPVVRVNMAHTFFRTPGPQFAWQRTLFMLLVLGLVGSMALLACLFGGTANNLMPTI